MRNKSHFFFYFSYKKQVIKHQSDASEANNGLKISVHAVDSCIISNSVCVRLTLPKRKKIKKTSGQQGPPIINPNPHIHQ